jgi:hypothetical protein
LLLLLETSLENVEVKKLNDVLDEKKRVELIDLTGLRKRPVLANVYQSKILRDPCHKFDVFLLHFLVFSRVRGKTRTTNYQAAKDFLKYM